MSKFNNVVFKNGENIFCAGDSAADLYFLVAGQVELVDPSGNVFGVIPTGQSFGESAILSGGVRAATVRAKGDVVCKKIKNEEAAQILSSYSPLLIVIMEALLLQQSMNNSIKRHK
jgi:CRP-like cAMP-binding protein